MKFSYKLASISLLVPMLALFASQAYAWTGPTASPPNNNAVAPINVGSASQTKNGNLYIGNGYGFSTPTLCLGTDCRSVWPAGGTSQWITSGTNIYYSAGNVGVGTASLTGTARLQVGDGTGQVLSRFLSDASDIYIGRNSTTAFGFSAGATAFIAQDSTKAFPLSIGTIGSQPLVFGTANTERARISSGGFLGVGLTNPQVKLDVSGSNVGYGGQVRISAPDYAQIVFYNSADMTLSASGRKSYIYHDVAANTFHINSGGSVNLSGTAVNANGSPVCTLNGSNCPTGTTAGTLGGQFWQAGTTCPSGSLMAGYGQGGTALCQWITQ